MRRLKRSKIILSLCMMLTMLFATAIFASCEKAEDSDSDPSSSETISLSQEQVTLDLFESATIFATKTNTDEAVTFKSSEESVVELKVDGDSVTLIAKAEGEATVTAKVGKASAEVAVTVTDSGLRPYITLSAATADITEGKTYSINASVQYKGNTLDDAQLSYEIDNPSVAQIDEQGNLTVGDYSNDAHSAVVTISGVYRGYAMSSESFEFNVKEDVVINVNSTVIDLYTADPFNEGHISELGYDELGIAVIVKGTELEASAITITSNDEDVVVYADNKIQAVGNGTTTITVSYTGVSGNVYSEAITVTVIRPTVELGIESVIDLDKSAVSNTLDLSDSPYAELIDLDGAVITIGDGKAEYTFVDKNVTFTSFDNCAVGEDLDLVIETKTVEFTGKVNLATLIIKSYDDFITIRDNYWTRRAAGDESTGKYRDGYYIIGADLDLSQTESLQCVSTNSKTSTTKEMYTGTNKKGFNLTGGADSSALNDWYGVIDGRGHVLSNLWIGDRGMLGVVAASSEVKNVALIIKRGLSDWWAGVGLVVNGTVDNCYIEVDSLNGGNGNGIIARYVGATAKITNNIVVLKAKDTIATATNHGVISGNTQAGTMIVNTFAIIVEGTTAPAIDTESGAKPNGATCVWGKFTSTSALVAAIAADPQTGFEGNGTASLAGFNDEYWTITNDNIVWTRAQ